MSEPGYIPPYHPIDLPVPVPNQDPATGSLVYVRFNVAWRKYLLGVAAKLLDPTIWSGSESEIRTAISQASSLMELIQADQPLIIFRQTEGCGLEASYDGGDTWGSIYDPSTCIADAFDGFLKNNPASSDDNLVFPSAGVPGISIIPNNHFGLQVEPATSSDHALIRLFARGTGAAIRLSSSGPDLVEYYESGDTRPIIMPNGRLVMDRVLAGPDPVTAQLGQFYVKIEEGGDRPYFIGLNADTEGSEISLIGPKGDPGEKGDKGDQGDPGEPGADGSGIDTVEINTVPCDTAPSGSITGTTLVLNLHDTCDDPNPPEGSGSDPACSVATYVSDYLISKFEDAINLIDAAGSVAEFTRTLSDLAGIGELLGGVGGILIGLATSLLSNGATAMRAEFTTEKKQDAKCALYCLLQGDNPPIIDDTVWSSYKTHLESNNLYEFFSFVSLYSLRTIRKLADIGVQFDDQCYDCDCESVYDWTFDLDFTTTSYNGAGINQQSANGGGTGCGGVTLRSPGWHSGLGWSSGVSGWVNALRLGFNGGDGTSVLVDLVVYAEVAFPNSGIGGQYLRAHDIYSWNTGYTIDNTGVIYGENSAALFTPPSPQQINGHYVVEITGNAYDHTTDCGGAGGFPNDQEVVITRIIARGTGTTPGLHTW